jgi:type IV pilus assembly protein PilA
MLLHQKHGKPATKLKGEDMRSKQKGFSLIELLIVVAIILIIAAIAIPNLLRARMAANEASAVGSLRTLNTASITYSSTYDAGFPASLAVMGGTPGATADCNAGAQLIDNVLSTGTKSGYTFTFTASGASQTVNSCTGYPSYSITAVPVVTGQTGQRSFYTDQSGVIRFDTTGSASVNSASPALQ